MTQFYPPVGFHFKVEFSGLKKQDIDVHFQSVSGLSVDMQTESVKEGGQNKFEHTLPVRSKYQNLILKRGLAKDSNLIRWCRNSIENLAIDPVNLTVTLLNQEHLALISWNVVYAWPVKWSVSDFDAMQGKLVIETLELNYNYFSIL